MLFIVNFRLTSSTMRIIKEIVLLSLKNLKNLKHPQLEMFMYSQHPHARDVYVFTTSCTSVPSELSWYYYL